MNNKTITRWYVNTESIVPYGVLQIDKMPKDWKKETIPSIGFNPELNGVTLKPFNFECNNIKTQIMLCGIIKQMSDGVIFLTPFLSITTDTDLSVDELDLKIREWWIAYIGKSFELESAKFMRLINANSQIK